MTVKRQPFIQSVKLADIDESQVIPTSLFYENGKPLIGREARDRCTSPEMLIEDFKIDLGNIDPDNPTKRNNLTSDRSPRKTALGLAKDFFEQSLAKLSTSLAMEGLSAPKKVLIAEPLSIAGGDRSTDSWLSNYRRSIRKVLQDKFIELDFLPEPFAVYQYYRYGCRHPILAQQRKHVALVLDFGGGTFDVSIVESAKSGDISQSGVNARPLGARSIPIGGFYINRLIANDLLHEAADKSVHKSELRKAIEFYEEHKNADDDYLSRLSETHRNFYRNYKTLLQEVERAKISICRSLAVWDLNADLREVGKYPISVPTNALSRNGATASLRLDVIKIKKLYEERIWTQKLKPAVLSTLERAAKELNGQEISVVLLSGGTSNIRWLRPLLERDISDKLSSAQVLDLSENFQEIVAKGLATECARRHYTGGQGDFRAVTYNRLCLAFKPDDGELEIRRFRPSKLNSEKTIAGSEDGVLLPSASMLRGLIGQPLRWKVRLTRPPKRTLDYFFMRSTFDTEDPISLYNVENKRVVTPAKTHFQQNIEIELTVRDDGTAEPRFIYSRNPNGDEKAVNGRPFYLDMTFAAQEATGETYLGFDFGTSTSAFSYVDSKTILEVEERSQSTGWRELSELVNDLPYVAAWPIARYLSDHTRPLERGREAFEGVLTLLAYLTYADLCSSTRVSSTHFKGLTHRSAGPLWALIKNICRSNGKSLTVTKTISELLNGSSFATIDTAVNDLALSKHGKAANIDVMSALGIVGNALSRILGDWQMGVFESVTPKRFAHGTFRGIFRFLRGGSPTFIHVATYEGPYAFTETDVFLVNISTGAAIPLSPLYVRGMEESSAGEEPDIYEYDSRKHDGSYSYRAIQRRTETIVRTGYGYEGLWTLLAEMGTADQPFERIEGLALSPPTF